MSRQGDLSNAGTSTLQRANPWYRLQGFPEGMLTPDEADELGPQATPGRVAFGRFSGNEAAVGLVLGTLFLVYLGTRVVTVKT